MFEQDGRLALRSMMTIDEDDDTQFASSEEDARKALGMDAGLPLTSETMFYVHRHRHEYQKALGDADRMKTAGAPPQQVALYRGMALADLQRDDEAEAELTSSLAVEPENWIALKFRAEVRLRRHDAQGAVGPYHRRSLKNMETHPCA